MTKERLYYETVSEIVNSGEVCLILLTDKKQERQLTIVSEKSIAIELEMRSNHSRTTQTMLPEVLVNVIRNQAKLEMELQIIGIKNGVYSVVLTNLFTLESVAIRACDAVLLSVASGIPIYIQADLMKRQSVPYHRNARGIALPVNTMPLEMLDKALEKAINDENYELASFLRDEKRKRSKQD